MRYRADRVDDTLPQARPCPGHRQIGDQLGQLALGAHDQGLIDPVREGVTGETALLCAGLQDLDGIVALGVRRPETAQRVDVRGALVGVAERWTSHD
jgi:hypothetical protein